MEELDRLFVEEMAAKYAWPLPLPEFSRIHPNLGGLIQI